MEKVLKKMNDKVNLSIFAKVLFIIFGIMLAIPSINYYVEKGTIFKFDTYYQFFLNNSDIKMQTLYYFIILLLITASYFFIIKNRKKLFKDFRSIMIFVVIISFIFVIVIPFFSSDVFYYLGIGRLDGKYHQNPYYTTIKEYVDNSNSNYENDTVLMQGYYNDWGDSTVVYGPIWTFICRIVALISFGNIDVGLFAFKILNVLIHLCNCYLLYKISNKKIFSLLYGINPFILIEAIAHVHNDIFIIFFTLLAFYFLIKKKKIVLPVIFIAFATAIKYFSILLLPFIIIYYFRREKPKIRLIKCVKYGLIFVAVLICCYLLYIQDFEVFKGLITQNEKIAKGIYVILIDYFKDIPNIIENTKKVLLGSFVIIYFFICVVMLNEKEIKFRKKMKTMNYLILAFLFLLITNFQPWYIMWIFPFIIWQEADIIKTMIGMSVLSQLANCIIIMYEENWHYGTPFIFTLIVGTLMYYIIQKNIRGKRIKQLYFRRKQIG